MCMYFALRAFLVPFINPLPVPIHASLSLWQRGQERLWTYLRGNETEDAEPSLSLIVDFLCGLGQITEPPETSFFLIWRNGGLLHRVDVKITETMHVNSLAWCLAQNKWHGTNAIYWTDLIPFFPFDSFLYCPSNPDSQLLPGVPSLPRDCLAVLLSGDVSSKPVFLRQWQQIHFAALKL